MSDKGHNSESIEAAWAPADPRDRLYDESADGREKTASMYRILAAFHPVLNIPVLINDSIQKFGWLRAICLWALVLTAGVGLTIWLH